MTQARTALRVGFAGTPEFAAVALRALLAAGFELPLVLSQPDRPAGRGMKLQASPVKQFALEKSIPVGQPHSLRLDGKYPEQAAAARAAIEAARADVMVVAAYGLILPQTVLDIPKRGCLNIHASLLPRWRGAAPIQRAILAGDLETGITIMQMDAGLDTGAMLSKTAVPIRDSDTAASLHDVLATAGASAIVAALANYATLVPVAQDDAQATYAAKLCKDEAQLDWNQPADALARAVRAYHPVPGAWTLLDGAPLKIWAAQAVSGSGGAGEVLRAEADQLIVACGSGALALQEIQPAGSKRMSAAAFLAGRPLPPGTRLGH